MVEEKVKSIIDSLSSSSSDDYLEVICLSLAKAIHADYVFVASLNDCYTKATTITLVAHDEIAENFSYTLKATPCENVSDGEVCTHVADVQQAYPDDQLLIDMNIHAYVGVPLKDEHGHTHAILVALFEREIANREEVTSLFMLFSGLMHKELEKQKVLKELKTRNTVIEESQEAIIICDKHNKIVSVNKAFTRMTGYAFREVVGQDPKMLSANKQSDAFYQQMWHSLVTKGSWSGELINRRKDGSEFPEWLSINTIHDDDNEVANYIAFFFDISKRKADEEKIVRQANFDLLTGVANRFAFLEQANQVIEAKAIAAFESALLFLDLDLFKEINDVYGHEFGDVLLIKVAERLQELIKPEDILARITGDGFAILVNCLTDNEPLEQYVNSILYEFNKPFVFNDNMLSCTVSLGAVRFSDSRCNAGELIKKAERAVQHAKDSGRSTFSMFTEEMEQSARYMRDLKYELERALKNRELSLVYQPIVSVAKKQVTKFEALVRWNKQGQWISPAEFIPLAENNGLIKQLGEFVLSEACLQLKQLKAQGFDDLVFNVNRSVKEIPLNENENDHWLVMVKMYGLEPKDICFELTESSLAPDKRNNEKLFRQLQQAGCRIALDDFGTGYSSLSYIRRFPIDDIKIDRAFVSDMSENPEDNILVSTIIAMSKSLGKTVVAEGVETKEQLELLMAMDCDYIQGFYFSKPIAAQDIPQYLNHFNYHQP